MGAEQTLASRNSQENTTSNNALCINDSSSQGLSLQRKTSAVQNNTGVMQRMAWIATKPLDYISEKSEKLREELPDIVNYGLDYALGGARTAVSNANAAKKADRENSSGFLDPVEAAGRYLKIAGINAVSGRAGDLINNARNTGKKLFPDWSEKIDTACNFADSGVDIAKNIATDVVNDDFDPFRYIDVCGKREPGHEVCYSSKVNYRIDHVANIDDLNHRVLHSHIIFSDNRLSSKSQNSDFAKDKESKVAADIRGRIKYLTDQYNNDNKGNSDVPGPSNIGFRGVSSKNPVSEGMLFSEQVLHKTYTERKLISSTPEQDLKLMKSIEDHDPKHNGSFSEYDLNECNCQHWVKAVIDGAK